MKRISNEIIFFSGPEIINERKLSIECVQHWKLIAIKEAASKKLSSSSPLPLLSSLSFDIGNQFLRTKISFGELNRIFFIVNNQLFHF